MTVLEIRISNHGNESLLVGGNMSQLAKSIAKLALHNEPFKNALNEAADIINDEIEAIEVRDEMIGYILNK